MFVCNDGQVVVDVAAAVKFDGHWKITRLAPFYPNGGGAAPGSR
jgi:hypothetical protein